ncbi:MAG: hypothetical protein ACPG8W_24825 [Candidatus Promineifilaceae bacterium]
MLASDPRIHQPIPGVSHQIVGDVDIISWKNGALPRNNRLYFSQTIGLLFFTPLAIFLTYRLVRELTLFNFIQLDRTGFFISVIVAIGCWVGMAASGFSFMRLAWTESITISNETITLSCDSRWGYKPKTIVIGDVWRMSYERYKHNQDQEYRYSVNLIHKHRQKLAYWMRKEEAYQLYQLLGGVFQRRGVAGLIQMTERIEQT